MSYKDRDSPILLESGLKSFLGHPGHNFPLLNDTKIAASTWPRENCGCLSMSFPQQDNPIREQYCPEGLSPSEECVGPYPSWNRQYAPNPYYESGFFPHVHRQFMSNSGNSKPPHSHSHGHTTIKDLAGSILGDDKNKDDGELWNTVEAQTAFLGPNLWDKTYEADLKYVDLDEFLSENGVSMDGLGTHSSLGPLNTSQSVPKRERSPSPSDCMSPDTMNPPSPADSNFSEALSMASSCRDFDPRKRVISDEDLKPQPLIKKSRKQFVPDDLKDDKYWARRRKNNLAAKRSRDARRMKENQIALRAGYLEKENVGLRQELERMKKENLILKNKLSKYEDV